MKKGKIKETTTIEKNIHGIKACHRMTLHLMIRESKLATEMIGLLRKWDNNQNLLLCREPKPKPWRVVASA